MLDIRQSAVRNRILAGMRVGDFSLLKPHLEYVDIPARHYLEKSGRQPEAVFFLEDGVATVRTPRRQTEVALIGMDGMTGLCLLHGADRPRYDTVVQFPGSAYRIGIETMRTVLKVSRTLHKYCLLYCHTLYVQAGDGAVANATGSIEERLSRWLLMVHDRVSGDEIKVTHELFSDVLGVRRPGVTIGLRRLEQEGLVSLRRGTTVILDREGLIRRTNGLYGIPESEHERLFGLWRRDASGHY